MNLRIALLIVAVVSVVFMACQSAEITAAKVYVQQKDYTAALEQLKVAEKNEPANPEVFLLEGKLYADIDSFARMTEAFDRALELDSTLIKDIDSWRKDKRAKVFRKGQKAGENKKWDRAIEYTETSVMIDPTFTDGWFNLGYLYQEAGNKEKSKEAYIKTYELEPTNTIVAKQAAVFYYNDGKTDEAIEVLNGIIENGEADVETWTLLAKMFVSKGEQDKAEEMLDNAEALDPDNPNLLFDRGVAKFGQKDYAAAGSFFQKILDIDPTNRDALYNLSLSLFNQEKFVEAIGFAESLVKNNPQDRAGWAQYSLCLLRGSQVDKGKAADLVVQSIEAMEAGNLDEAIKNLEIVTKKYDKWCAPWAVLKVAYEENGDTDGSAKAQTGLDNCGE